uniref:Uncharacterized protein n=1 Tax=Siphoviridae sp. ctzyE57 TaxID=2827982 RepID=A0A8S5SGJ3_9CAUD|nr:MAG TPA: hypothetical protein [Siphoviridae sp. ctzyE57]
MSLKDIPLGENKVTTETRSWNYWDEMRVEREKAIAEDFAAENEGKTSWRDSKYIPMWLKACPSLIYIKWRLRCWLDDIMGAGGDD